MVQPTTQQLYPQPSGANAVSINIYNPQAYGSAPANGCAQQAPYAYTNSFYQVPQASMYQPQTTPEAYQQLIPQQAPVAPAPQFAPNELQAPLTQTMPESAMETAPVEVKNDEENNAQKINTDELIQGLSSEDMDVKEKTIDKIASYAQEAPEVALQVVSEPIMNSLINVIKEDTSKLEGPTQEQINVAEKINKGEKLTPEEETLAEQLSPRDKANKNKICALYTLAMIQKLQRDELDQYIEKQKENGEEAIAPLKIEDLLGYDEISNIIKNDSIPELKIAAIQALQYVAKPEDKAVVEGLLKESLNSSDEDIKKTATEAMNKFNA